MPHAALRKNWEHMLQLESLVPADELESDVHLARKNALKNSNKSYRIMNCASQLILKSHTSLDFEVMKGTVIIPVRESCTSAFTITAIKVQSSLSRLSKDYRRR